MESVWAFFFFFHRDILTQERFIIGFHDRAFLGTAHTNFQGILENGKKSYLAIIESHKS